MDFTLTEEQTALRAMAAEFVDREITPHVVEWDRAESVPRDLVPRLGELGFLGMTIPEEYGGVGGDHVSYALVMEELGRGDSSVRGLVSVSLGLVAKSIATYGTEEQRQRWLPGLCSGELLGCFGLTEPDTGSDAASLSLKAVRDGDDYVLTGSKMFITNGTWADVAIIFARTGGPGPKGITAFLVPTDTPGLTRTTIHGKLGLRGQPTAQLFLDEVRVGPDAILGEENQGFRIAMAALDKGRVSVAAGAVGAARGDLESALAHAKERVQGADLTQQADKTAPRVTITHHPDVRRSLMLQKSYAEAMRALVLYTATFQDAVQIATARGEDPAEYEAMNDLLLPLVKGVGSERSYALLAESLQTLGGSGYLQDYPIEQYIRDSKIDTLYEGTTAIQGMDLFFRKIVKNNGQALGKLMGEIQEFAKSDPGNGQLKNECALLAQAAADVQAMVESMVGNAMRSMEEPREIYKVGLNTTRLLLSLGDLVLGWLLLRQAEIALARIDGADDNDRNFYLGKIAAARFFADQVLPRLSVERAIAERTTLDLMDLPEEAF